MLRLGVLDRIELAAEIFRFGDRFREWLDRFSGMQWLDRSGGRINL
jgi:hypothetical protein